MHEADGDLHDLRNLFDLDGRTALVTGGASGLGQAIAAGMASFGANVVLSDIDELGLEESRRLLQGISPNVIAIPADVTNLESVEELVRQAVARYDRIDISFQVPAISAKGPLVDLTPEDFNSVMGLNVSGVFNCLREVGKIMIHQGGGKLINLASIFSTVALPGRAAYCASKGAVAQLTKVAALEWAPHNIQVNAIAPAHFKTPMTRNLWEDVEKAEEVIDRNPQHRFAAPKEIVGAAVLLASPASSFITGTILHVDGGWTAQ